MFCAGYETTANTLAFTTYCLATNPDKAEKLMQVSMMMLQRCLKQLHVTLLPVLSQSASASQQQHCV